MSIKALDVRGVCDVFCCSARIVAQIQSEHQPTKCMCVVTCVQSARATHNERGGGTARDHINDEFMCIQHATRCIMCGGAVGGVRGNARRRAINQLDAARCTHSVGIGLTSNRLQLYAISHVEHIRVHINYMGS